MDSLQGYTFTNAQGQAVSDGQSNISQDSPASYEDIINKDIFELMGIASMPDDKKQALFEKMQDTILNRVIARLTDDFSDGDLKVWEEVAKSGNQDQMAEFLKGKNIDFPGLMLRETLLYKTELAELAKPLRQAAGQIK